MIGLHFLWKNDGIPNHKEVGAFSELFVLDNFGNLKCVKILNQLECTFNYLYIDNCCVDLENRVWTNGVIQVNLILIIIGSSIVEGNFSEGPL
ncbi:MAG: hypothetical protein IPQ19_09330 [Bacteroidetes bacterium]|nr:hypothetical protein [Bacteroidota bacterium]